MIEAIGVVAVAVQGQVGGMLVMFLMMAAALGLYLAMLKDVMKG